MAQTLDQTPYVNGQRLRVSAIALATALLVNSPLALANPSGMEVVRGSVTESLSGNTLTLTTDKGDAAVINWQSFNIGSGERTHFNQSNSYARVLNRVVGPGSSAIDGALSSNGSVFIINRNGIAVGGGGVVDTAALVMSTLDVDNNAFMDRADLSFIGGGAGITNNGSISADRSITLIGSGVTNAGSIYSGGGDITLAAGSRVRISGTGFDNVFIEVPGDATQVANTGSLTARNGEIGLLAAVQINTGTADTPRLILDDDGEVVITTDPEGEEPEVEEPVAEVDPEEPVVDNPETNPGFGPEDPDEGTGGCHSAPACEPLATPGTEQPDPNDSGDPGSENVDSPPAVVDVPENPPFAPSTDGGSAPVFTPVVSIPEAPHTPTFIVDLEPANLDPFLITMVTQNATDLVRLQESLNETATNDTDLDEVASRTASETADSELTLMQCQIM